MNFRRLIVPPTVAIICAIVSGQVLAQNAPAAQADQPDDLVFPPAGNPPSANVGTSPVNPLISKSVPPGVTDCMQFVPLREEAEKRGRLIKDASERHAGPVEACKLISSYSMAESQMISFIETHATACAIPARIGDQLKSGHKNTEALQTKVCNVAQQMQRKGLPAGPVGDFYLRDDVSKQQPAGPVGDFDLYSR